MVPVSAAARVPDGSDEQRARELSSLAAEAKRDGRKDIAAERLREAWGAYRNPWYICELGSLEIQLDRARDAAQSLTICLRVLVTEDQKFLRPKIERDLEGVLAKVGALTVETNVPGAEVFIDGKAAGKLPLIDPIFLDPGSHGVEVKAPGYRSDVRLAVLNAGNSMLARMRLEPMRVDVAPPPPERALEPPEREREPPSAAPAPPIGRSAPVPARMPERAAEPVPVPVRWPVVFTGLGLGIAGAAAGTASFMAASTSGEEGKAMYRALAGSSAVCEQSSSGPCKDAEDKIDASRTLTAVGAAGVAMSAVGVGLLVFEFLRSGPQEKDTSGRVTVEATRSGGALKVTGSF